MKLFLNQREWCALPQEVRYRLADQFSIGKSEGVHMEQQNGITTLFSDGHSQNDLMKLNAGAMMDLLGEGPDFMNLLQRVIQKLDPNAPQPPEALEPEITTVTTLNPTVDEPNTEPKRKGMPKGGWPRKLPGFTPDNN